MESNAFGGSHLPSQALVVLSEAASGLHEALRGQRPFPTRLPDAKDLHNMSLVGSYGSHLLHSFHPHLLQTLNHGMLANGSAAAASYFASERAGLTKPSVLTNFQLPSAFSPPKYIGISLDQNLFNGNDSFRTDSASPTCTSHESLEGSNDYDGEKGESPRSNASDPRDLRHAHSKSSATCASSMAAVSAAAAAAVASIASSSAAATTATATHLAHHTHPHHTHHLASLSGHHGHHPNGSLLAASMGHTLGLTAPPGCSGLRPPPGHVPEGCPVCGLKLTTEEWNSHFLAELDRLYKLSSGMERANIQATYMFAPPCPAQENAIRTSHSRWETFQRIRNNRQNRLRIKVRKRKYGDMFFMENSLCSSCPICKRKYALETGKLPAEEENKMQEEIETVDVESCNDDVPDSGSEIQSHQQHHHHPQPQHAHMPSFGGSSSHSSGHNSSNGANLHNSNSQPGKLDGILYRTACVINKEHNTSSGGEDDVSTNVPTTTTISGSSSSSSSGGSSNINWSDSGHSNNNTQGHISVKNVSELSSTTHHYYNADSCHEEHQSQRDMNMDTCNNDSDEDVIVDDDDSIKMSSYNTNKKRKYEDSTVGSSRISDNPSPIDDRPRSEPQVTSTETSLDHSQSNNNNNNNNNNNTKYTTFEDLRVKQQQQQHSPDHVDTDRITAGQSAHILMSGLTQLDSKVGISSDLKPDNEENKCFICKTGIKDLSSDSFLRGRNFYFHQSCANVMSSYRFNKDLQPPTLKYPPPAAQQQPSSSSSSSSNSSQFPASPSDKLQQQQQQSSTVESATNDNRN